MKEYKCKKCGGTLVQQYFNLFLGPVKLTGKRENYMCLNCGRIYNDSIIEEIADMNEDVD